MNIDTRINNDFFLHPKTARLQNALGEIAPMFLIKLWVYASKFFPAGAISGLSDKMIEEQIGWAGKHEGNFIETLENIGFVERNGDKLVLHDWEEHNPWASNEKSRKDLNRFNSLSRYFPNVSKMLHEHGINAITAEQYKAIKEAAEPEKAAYKIFKLKEKEEGLNERLQLRAQMQSHAKVACDQKSPISISISKPNPDPNNKIKEPDCEFVEFRDFYDRNVLAEGSRTGWEEFLNLKTEMGRLKKFPGIQFFMTDIETRLDQGFWAAGIFPSMKTYLRERIFEQKVTSRKGFGPKTFTQLEAENEERVRAARMKRAAEYDSQKQASQK